MRADNTVSQHPISSTISTKPMDVEHSFLLQKKAAAARVAREEETADQRKIRLKQQRNRSRSRTCPFKACS